ncbi:4-hydroxy-3-methylbut-2-enyl diphosphate reductase [Pseudothermotoga thermarum]|uniref:4-hydroxy-3-methylbut-2-enyl diphosphate reductase n=1 Tax=Pseudothermotoga thermarum DSM 5069 TaxID=688269 RepID=F7YVB2_9THEM|nr:4-hydroxy-3-methylbut-2-enyl diphosphate reductase [Pseudothermotoga thermarum]AEH50415.1 hydroxymethylbutenyl pyrophosphate reductase [Pseudothermotoga thermarum DSM 5069]
MNILVAKNVGFCFGVKRALDLVLKLLEENKKVYLLGDLVHNNNVMNHLKQKGAETISLSDVPHDAKDSVLVVRAHGVPPEDLQFAKMHFGQVVDTTCPIVQRLFQLAKKMSEEGYKILTFGKKEHPEMIALKGYVKDAFIEQNPIELSGKVCLLSQTTMSIEEYKQFASKVMEISNVNEFRMFNTICRVSAEREAETRQIAQQSDVVIVVGGKHSSNTKKLVAIAEKYAKVIHVEGADEVDQNDLSNYKTIGVVSGTSTPYEDVKKIIEKLLSGRESHGY